MIHMYNFGICSQSKWSCHWFTCNNSRSKWSSHRYSVVWKAQYEQIAFVKK